MTDPTFRPFLRLLPRPWLAVLAVLLSGVIGVLTLIPTSAVPGAPGGDKLHHLLAFGSLAFAAVLAWPHRWVLVIVVVALYGGAIELIQPYVGRSGEWADWFADLVGAILGGALARVCLPPSAAPGAATGGRVRGNSIPTFAAGASIDTRKQRFFRRTSLLGVALFAPLYALASGLQAQGWVTPLFGQTVLWSILAYGGAVFLQGQALALPPAQQRLSSLMNGTLPFLVLILGFALFQIPYSRGAVALSAVTVTGWFLLIHVRARSFSKLELVVLQPSVETELMEYLAGHDAALVHDLVLIPWADGEAVPPTCDGVLLSNRFQLAPDQVKRLAELKRMQIRLYSSESLSEMLTGRLGAAVLADPYWQPDAKPVYSVLKRLLDVILVLVTVPVWGLIGIILAAAVKLDSPGPVLFSQLRTGRWGRPFRMYKFRTMIQHEPGPAQFTAIDDERITRLGRWLRKYRFDEIPQLFNVLLGQMSIVGPRPEQDSLASTFAVRIPSYPYRHVLRPGITGWAQVTQGYVASQSETSVKLSYDLFYVKNHSLVLDLLIMLKTARTVLTGFGAR